VIGGFPNSKTRHWTATSAALFFVVGALLAAVYALSHHRNASSRENLVVHGPQTVNLEAQGLFPCMACVMQSRSWQRGTCNPTEECLMMNEACYDDAIGCKQWHEREEANSACNAQADCANCVASNRLCLWSDDAGCFMGADYWGPGHLVVRHGETCSAAPKTTEFLKAADPKPGSISDGFFKSPREPFSECMMCVEMGKSWQAGGCNPSLECMVTDIGCFQDALGCKRWHQEQEAASKCTAQKDCSSCLGSNSLCVWRDDSGCFTGSGLWGPPEGVFQNGDACPNDNTLPLSRAELPRESALMALKS